MAITAKWYGLGLQKVLAGSVVWGSDTIKVSLHSSALTPAQDTDEFWDDVSATELSTAGGYTAGGATLGTKNNYYTASSNTAWLDAADASWTASGAGFTCRWATLRKNTGTPGTSPLLGYWDLGGDQALTTAGAILTLQFDATTGIAALIAA